MKWLRGRESREKESLLDLLASIGGGGSLELVDLRPILSGI